jgi:DNA polymerase-3 subunit epsilon
LRLTRPLCSFDLETTGLDPDRDRIVEIAMVWLHPDGSRTSWTDKVNPQMPIPPASTAIHGISDADVRDAKTFAQLAPKVLAMLAGCDLTGFNMEKFDIPFLAAEFRRCALVFPEPGTAIVDAFVLFQRKEPRDLTAALRLYCGQERKDAHQALADAEGAADILLGQLRHYPDLPLDPQGLHDWLHPRDPNWHDPEGKLTWDGDSLLCNFGKHKGKALLDMARTDADYLRWLLNKDFSLAVKDAVSLALRGHQPPKPTL